MIKGKRFHKHFFEHRLRRVEHKPTQWYCPVCEHNRNTNAILGPCLKCGTTVTARLRFTSAVESTRTERVEVSNTNRRIAAFVIDRLKLKKMSHGDVLIHGIDLSYTVALKKRYHYEVWIDYVRFTGWYKNLRRIVPEVKTYVMRDSVLQVRLPVDLHKYFKSDCAKKGISMSDAIREFIEISKKNNTARPKAEQV